MNLNVPVLVAYSTLLVPLTKNILVGTYGSNFEAFYKISHSTGTSTYVHSIYTAHTVVKLTNISCTKLEADFFFFKDTCDMMEYEKEKEI